MLSTISDNNIDYAHVLEECDAVGDIVHNDQEIDTLQNNMLSHEDEIEANKHEAGSSHAIIVSDYYEFKYLFALDTNHRD